MEAVDDGRDSLGHLVFTCGATPDALGFRVSETLGVGEGHTQLTAVWTGQDGHFRGLVEGHHLGIARTAGLNGVAIDHPARDDTSVLGVLGTGPQARMGARVACAVREFDAVRVFSPTREHRETFAEKLPTKLGVPVAAHDSADAVVRGTGVLYAATDARSPVFEADWLRGGTHGCTLGPKFEGAHEIPLALAERASAVVTDSLAQRGLRRLSGPLLPRTRAIRRTRRGVRHRPRTRPGRRDAVLFGGAGRRGDAGRPAARGVSTASDAGQ